MTDADDVPAFREAIPGRIQALANSQRLLSKTNWRRAGLKDIFRSELALFDNERCTLQGDDIQLKPAIAQAFAIVAHELATNAAKYGALSTAEGRVHVSWTIKNDELNVCWPPVRKRIWDHGRIRVAMR